MLNRMAKKRPVLFGILATAVFYILILAFPLPTFYLPQDIRLLVNGIMRILISIPVILCLGMLHQENGFKHAFSIKGILKGLLVLSPVILYIITNVLEFFSGKGFQAEDVFHYMLINISSGILEEPLFRGLLLGGLLKKYVNSKAGRIISVFACGLVFGASHLPNIVYEHNAISVIKNSIFAALLGICFGAAYLYSGNLLGCILTHSLTNVSSVLCGGLTQVRYSALINILPVAKSIILYIILPIVVIVFTILAKQNKKDENNVYS